MSSLTDDVCSALITEILDGTLMADSDNRDDDNRDDDNLQPRLKKRKLQDTEEDENDDVDAPAAAAVCVYHHLPRNRTWSARVHSFQGRRVTPVSDSRVTSPVAH